MTCPFWKKCPHREEPIDYTTCEESCSDELEYCGTYRRFCNDEYFAKKMFWIRNYDWIMDLLWLGLGFSFGLLIILLGSIK